MNPAYTQILGVPRDELLGTVPSLLRPTPAAPVARQPRAADVRANAQAAAFRDPRFPTLSAAELATTRCDCAGDECRAGDGHSDGDGHERQHEGLLPPLTTEEARTF